MGEDLLLLGLNLAGIVVFAASGAVAAVAKQLDLFGVAVVGVVTALGGGALRDVAINEAPPIAFTDWRYPVTAATTAVVVFWIHGRVSRLRRTMLTLDAAGLALFTVVGTETALDAGIPQVGACMIGMITAIGGGVIRDLLTAQIPVVLLREVYAVASLLGTVVITACHALDVPPLWYSLLGAGLVFGLRLISLQRNWSAPTPRQSRLIRYQGRTAATGNDTKTAAITYAAVRHTGDRRGGSRSRWTLSSTPVPVMAKAPTGAGASLPPIRARAEAKAAGSEASAARSSATSSKSTATLVLARRTPGNQGNAVTHARNGKATRSCRSSR